MKVNTINPKTDGFEAEFKEISDDQMAMRVVDVPGQKRKFNLVQDQHFALWTIKPTIGYLAEELSGQYTSEKQARQAIEIYLGKIEAEEKKQQARIALAKKELAETQVQYMQQEVENKILAEKINEQEAKTKLKAPKKNAKVETISID